MLSRDFHDEKLISITATDDTLTLEISAKDGIYRIIVSDLEKLRVSDFKEGNIISAARIVHPEQPSNGESTAASLLKHAYEFDDANLQRNAKTASFLEKKIKQHEEGSLIILEIEPSYGAYLVAIGKKVTEEKRPANVSN